MIIFPKLIQLVFHLELGKIKKRKEKKRELFMEDVKE